MQKLFAILLFSLTVSIVSAQSKSTHTVVKGETIYAIAKQYHVTVEALEKANKATLGENFKLKIGQKLVIPAGSSKTETKSEKPTTAAAPKTEKPAAVTPKKDKPEAAKPVKPTRPESQTASAPAGEPGIHIVTKGETVYAIAKANGLTWRQIKDANHLSDDMKLKLGQKLILPSKNPDAMYKPAAKDAEAETKPAPKAEVAKTTEQGKDYLTAKPAEIKKPEPAPKSTAETIPQIKAEPAESKPAPALAKVEKAKETPGDENPFLPRPADAPKAAPKEALKNENVNSGDYASVFAKYAESGKKKVVYRGISTFMQTENPGNQFLALYNYADMGSILKVTNLMSKESIYVKVIGKVPATEAQRDVILKVSNDAASKLKVTEDKFLVEVTGFNIQ